MATRINFILAMAWSNKSLAFANLGRYHEALEAADKAIAADPNFSLIWSNKSFFLANLGRNKESLDAADEAIELNPDLAMAWVNKSLALYNLGRNEDALNAADKAIKLDPSLAMAWVNKSLALANLGRNEEASKAEDKALELNHNLATALFKNKDETQSKVESKPDRPKAEAGKGSEKAQYSAAEAQVKINESITGISEEMADVGLALERAENKTEELKARVEAIDELMEAGTLEDLTGGRDKIDRELAKISNQSKVESELARIKAEAGKGSEKAKSGEESTEERKEV